MAEKKIAREAPGPVALLPALPPVRKPPRKGQKCYRVVFYEGATTRQLALDVYGTSIQYTTPEWNDYPGQLSIRGPGRRIVFTMPISSVIMAFEVDSMPSAPGEIATE